jgi:hypothetical protein
MTAFIPSSSITRPIALRPLGMATWPDSPFLTSAAQEMSLASATLPSASTTFEPIVPDTSVLLGFLGIILVSAVAGWVWANQVVPVSRTNLAISKRTGPVKDYLDELREAGANTAVSNATDTGSSSGSGREFEQWLFTDWLEKPEKKAGRQKEPALPILKNAKWNSGDNPVLAASALIGLGVLFTSVTERIAASF